jgi:sulfatase maturation enzyme AslB (radical SAM superfamily)
MNQKMRKIKKLVKIIKTGNISFLWNPKRIGFVPTLICNLNCKMCHQKDIRRVCEPEITLLEIDEKLYELKKQGYHLISFLGGEVFVNKRRGFEILNLAEKHKFLFSVATNGFRLEIEDIKKLSKYRGLVEVAVSLDGPHHVHDKIRGVPDAYMWAEHTIKTCKKFGIPVSTVTVIQKDNIEWIPHLCRLFGLWEVDSTTFVYEYSVSKREIEATKAILGKLSGGKKVIIFASDSVGKNTFKYDLKNLMRQIKNAKFFIDYFGLKTNLESISLDILESVKAKTVTKDFECECDVLGDVAQVDWTGAYDFCPFIRIDGASKEEILKIQKKIKMLPICDRCCSLTIGDKK